MSLTAQAIIDRASATLQDVAGVRWTPAELLNWLNDAQREIAKLRPDVYMRTEFATLVGGTRQLLPSNGVELVDVVRNMPDGLPIRAVDRQAMDSQQPTWHSDEADATVKYYMYDRRVPRSYYVYPPQPTTNCGSVELVYKAVPADILVSDVLLIPGVYANAILDYMLYRAYSKNAEYAANAPRTEEAYKAFMNAVGANPVPPAG